MSRGPQTPTTRLLAGQGPKPQKGLPSPLRDKIWPDSGQIQQFYPIFRQNTFFSGRDRRIFVPTDPNEAGPLFGLFVRCLDLQAGSTLLSLIRSPIDRPRGLPDKDCLRPHSRARRASEKEKEEGGKGHDVDARSGGDDDGDRGEGGADRNGGGGPRRVGFAMHSANPSFPFRLHIVLRISGTLSIF